MSRRKNPKISGFYEDLLWRPGQRDFGAGLGWPKTEYPCSPVNKRVFLPSPADKPTHYPPKISSDRNPSGNLGEHKRNQRVNPETPNHRLIFWKFRLTNSHKIYILQSKINNHRVAVRIFLRLWGKNHWATRDSSKNDLFGFKFFLRFVKSQKSAWRKDLPSLTQFGRKMRNISSNEAFRLSNNGCFKECFVVRVRQRVTERWGGHNVAPMVNMVQEGSDFVFVKSEFGPI